MESNNLTDRTNFRRLNGFANIIGRNAENLGVARYFQFWLYDLFRASGELSVTQEMAAGVTHQSIDMEGLL